MRSCAVCRQLDSLPVTNGEALAPCINEFLVNKAWSEQEMFLPELCQPFGVFWNVKEWGKYGFRVECWASSGQKAQLCAEVQLADTARQDAGQHKALQRIQADWACTQLLSSFFWSSDHSSVMLTQYQFATLPKWNSAGEKRRNPFLLPNKC